VVVACLMLGTVTGAQAAGIGQLADPGRLKATPRRSQRLIFRSRRPRFVGEIAARATGRARVMPTVLGSQLVGRVTELDTAREALASVQGGHGRLVFVHGEAGIGTTRLCQELWATGDPGRTQVLAGRADPGERRRCSRGRRCTAGGAPIGAGPVGGRPPSPGCVGCGRARARGPITRPDRCRACAVVRGVAGCGGGGGRRSGDAVVLGGPPLGRPVHLGLRRVCGVACGVDGPSAGGDVPGTQAPGGRLGRGRPDMPSPSHWALPVSPPAWLVASGGRHRATGRRCA